MNRAPQPARASQPAPAPRSIDAYLEQLHAALKGADPALIQDALYDAEEYLRAECAAHPEKSEADVLELIASTYGAPEEVAAAYRDTEAKVNAALRPVTVRSSESANPLKRFFSVYSDSRAYLSLFYMLLTLVTGIIYFTFVVTGLSLSAGLAVLVIGFPFFLAFIGIARVLALGEGRLLEAISGERMPRRPIHPGPRAGLWAQIGAMLKDPRTWTTLSYLLLMLPVGIFYFTVAVVGVSLAGSLVVGPFLVLAQHLGWDFNNGESVLQPAILGAPLVSPFLVALGVVIFTALMHAARGIGRAHVFLARSLLVKP
jgi:uncharacterized membrane protein